MRVNLDDTDWFSGELTKEGLDKLRNNFLIVRIAKDRTGQTVGSETNYTAEVDPDVYAQLNHSKWIQVIVEVHSKELINETISSIPETEFTFIREMMFSNGFVGEITAEGINILANNSNVTKILFDRVVHTTLQQSLPLINATDVWDLGYTGEGQTICVIDSGINYTHPDLGSCAYTNNISDGSCAKVIGGYDFRNDDDPIDDQGHGTHVAGIAAAQDEISPNNIEVK